MALLFIDSFDHYATADINKKWSNAGAAVISPSNGRRGGNALLFTTYPQVIKVTPPITTFVTGFALKTGTLTSTPGIFSVRSINDKHLTFVLFNTGIIKVQRTDRYGNLTDLGSTTISVAFDAYQYIEIKAKIDPTAGFVIIKINGNVALNITNINTVGFGELSQIASLGYGFDANPGYAGTNLYLDDLYLCDTNGLSSDFLGDVRIDALYPSADGTYSDFTPDTGTVHYSRVNETLLDTTSYNSGSAVGQKDTYAMTDLTVTNGSVIAVQINNAVMKSDAGTRVIANYLKSSGSESQSDTVGVGTSQSIFSTVHERNPLGNSLWTPAAVNAMECGTIVVG